MNNEEKYKIISMMPHGPPYHYSTNEKPDIYWEKTDGSLIGFWPREWLDFLGEAVLEVTQIGKDLGTEGDRIIFSVKVVACLGVEDELDEGIPFPPPFVPSFKVGLDGC